MSQFTYLLNAMENAAQANDPATAGYGLARRAVLEYVQSLEELERALRDIEMETRRGGQWTQAEINEVCLDALAKPRPLPEANK